MLGKGATFLDRPMAAITAKDMAKLTTEAAKRSNTYALGFLPTSIRKELTGKEVRYFAKDGDTYFFSKNGQLSKDGRDQMIECIRKMFNLASNSQAKRITVEQFLNKMLEPLAKYDAKLSKAKENLVIRK